MALTPLQIKTATKSLSDGGGLWLQVSKKNGGKSWVFIFTAPGGKQREMGLGSTDRVSLKDARILAADARHLVSKGIDPIDTRKAQRQAMETAIDQTFAKAMDLFITDQKSGWRYQRMEKDWRASLNAYAAPLMKLPVNLITTADVLAVLRPIWATKTELASRVRNRVERILTYAKGLGWRDANAANPAAWRDGLQAMLPAPAKVSPVEHHKAVPSQQVPALMAELRASTDRDAAMLELLVLTAVRVKPIWLMEWSEIDLEARLWHIPGSHEKSGLPHTVPLSGRCVALLQAIPRGDGERVFNVGEHAMWTLMQRMGIDATVHGFRSSFRDWAGELGHNTDAAEAALSHALGSRTRRSYQRGRLLDQRAALMAAWADFCGGAEIIELKRAA